MKQKIKLLCLLLCCLTASSAIAQQVRNISKQEALSIAKMSFNGQDVDYYLCEDAILNIRSEGHNLSISQSDTWTFFVDAEPLKGWEHDCYLVRVAKRIGAYQSPAPLATKFRLPPNGNFTPLDVKNRYGVRASQKPHVRKTALPNEAKSAAERTYAVILSGGHNKLSNYERYWNDCSFVYQTLVNKYGVPKNNISVVMSDGTDPAADMHATTGGYKFSPLDLDNDGQPDIQYAATRANVKNVLSSLSQRIGKDDHLFFYVIDHGGTRDKNNQSYICLWNGESLHDYELADWLRPFNEKSVYVNAVLGQCFSGGFIEELSKVGCFVAAASKGSESSWSCGAIPYDEFVYHWTSAINEGNAFGQPIYSDVDNNHRVTMEEAFDYAYQHDRRRPMENPQHKSNPISVGEDLAFNNLPNAVDLYIKDSEEDTGKEPNTITKEFWKSPDIWVRNKRDHIKEHENPEYSEDHPACFVYVRVHNRGKEDFNGVGQWVHVYWAKASTGLTVKALKGKELYQNHVTGQHLRAVPVPKIPAGEYRDVVVIWGLPDDMIYSSGDNYTEKHHFCLTARVLDQFDDETYDSSVTYFDVRGSNDIAQKNVSIVSRQELAQGINVFVRNASNDNQKYSLELITHTAKDEQLFTKADVKMTMAPTIYKAWKLGGLRATDISYAPAVSPYCVRLKSKNSKLEDICMNGAEFEKVTMKFDFHTPSVYPNEKYTFDLIQKDETGKIVGGETFIVEAPILSYKPIDIVPIEIGTGKYELSADWRGTDYSARWTDRNGEDIGEGNKITVIPTSGNNEFSVTALSSQGEMAQESVTLESMIGFKSVTPTLIEDFINVELHNPVNSKNAMLQVSSLTQGGTVLLNKALPYDVKKTQLDATSLSSGMYILSYLVNGQIIDSKKFYKK